MPKPIVVFSKGLDPAIDSPSFNTTFKDAAIRVNVLKTHIYISTTAIQAVPDPFDTIAAIAGGGFIDAWHKKYSGGYAVWQMRTNAARG